MARCETEMNALDDAILRLKIGLNKPLDRENANLLAEDLANLQLPFNRIARCVGRAIARAV